MSAAAVLLVAVALEVLPVSAWLATLAALDVGNPSPAALPFWLLYASVLAAVGVGTLSRTRRVVSALPGALVALGWLATLLVALRVSPAAYSGVGSSGSFSLDWVLQVGLDILNGSGRLTSGAGVALLVAYTWWRGLRLGRDGATYDRMSLVFRWGLTAIILAIVADVAVSGSVRAALGSQLALLLPVEVGAGLAALALSHIDDYIRPSSHASMGTDAQDEGALRRAPWLATSLGLAAAVVVGALLLALIFSYDTLQALAQALQPVGDAIGTAIDWVIEALALVLFVLFDWIFELILSHGNHHPRQIQLPSSAPQPRNPAHLTHPAQGIPIEWVVVGRIVLAVAIALVIVIVLVRLLRRFAAEQPEPEPFDETREALDGGAMLRAQLRSLFSRGRDRQRAPADDLPPGSVRRLYRDTLRTALQAGRGRRLAETPEEYLGRVAPGMLDSSVGENGRQRPDTELAELTQLYERARYGELPDRPADRQQAERASRRMSEWLGQEGRQRRQ